MLRAMIVDDEAPARSELRFLLEQTGKIGTITEASSVRSAIEMLMESRVDVVFLDISMPGASGLQLAEALHKLKNPPAIVFVTAYSDHAVEAFDVDAVDYLMKPVEEARLDRAIEKVMQRAKPVTDSKVTIERIPVEKGGRKVLIPVDDIRFIMAKDDYSCIYTVDDRFLSTTSLAQFEAKLCDFGFFRVHRRYIVNLACVTDAESLAHWPRSPVDPSSAGPWGLFCMYLPNRFFLRKGSHEQCKRQAYRHHLGHPRLFIACALG